MKFLVLVFLVLNLVSCSSDEPKPTEPVVTPPVVEPTIVPTPEPTVDPLTVECVKKNKIGSKCGGGFVVHGLGYEKLVMTILEDSNHADAVKACEDLVSGGFDNWQLPNISRFMEADKQFFVDKHYWTAESTCGGGNYWVFSKIYGGNTVKRLGTEWAGVACYRFSKQ